MKKIVFVFVAALACSLMIMSCASEKKSKKSPSGITVEVTPSVIGLIETSSPTRTLTAVVKNNGVIQPDASVNWVVNPTNFGTCVPNQSSSTVFTADTTQTGQGTIVASYNGTASAPVQFSINEAPIIIDSVVISPSTPQTISSTNTITFTATAMAGTTTITTAQLNWNVTGPGSISPNPSISGNQVTFTPSGTGNAVVKASYGNVNSSNVNITISDAPVPTTLTFLLDGFTTAGGLDDIYGWGGAPTDAYTVADPWPVMSGYDGTSRKIFSMTWNSGWDGPTLVRTSAGNLDATQYTKLVFYAKVMSGTGDIIVRTVGNGGTTFNQAGCTLTASWQKFEIPLTTARDNINSIICFVLAGDQYTVEGKIAPILPFTFYIDNVYFE